MYTILTALLVTRALAQFPDLSGFTWLHQESASLIQQAGQAPVLSLMNNNGAQDERGLMTTLPSPPYAITVCMTLFDSDPTQQISGTLMLRNSASDKFIGLVFEWENGGPLIANTYGTQTTNADSGHVSKALEFHPATTLAANECLKIYDDGFARTQYYSNDAGVTWIQFWQESSRTWISPDQVGITGFTLAGAAFPGFTITVNSFTIDTNFPTPPSLQQLVPLTFVTGVLVPAKQ